VDLPGYGYAKVPPKMREHWKRLMEAYFRRRESLAGLVIVVDARRGFGESDEAMLQYAEARDCPVQVLLTKADKLNRNESRVILRETQSRLGGRARAQLFSAETREGVDAAQGALGALLGRRS
jgi:GTP-binding protein